MKKRIGNRESWDMRQAELSRTANEERNAGKDDSARCPAIHFGGNCCQHDAAHDGPHIAEFQFSDGSLWAGKYCKW